MSGSLTRTILTIVVRAPERCGTGNFVIEHGPLDVGLRVIDTSEGSHRSAIRQSRTSGHRREASVDQLRHDGLDVTEVTPSIAFANAANFFFFPRACPSSSSTSAVYAFSPEFSGAAFLGSGTRCHLPRHRLGRTEHFMTPAGIIVIGHHRNGRRAANWSLNHNPPKNLGLENRHARPAIAEPSRSVWREVRDQRSFSSRSAPRQGDTLVERRWRAVSRHRRPPPRSRRDIRKLECRLARCNWHTQSARPNFISFSRRRDETSVSHVPIATVDENCNIAMVNTTLSAIFPSPSPWPATRPRRSYSPPRPRPEGGALPIGRRGVDPTEGRPATTPPRVSVPRLRRGRPTQRSGK